MRLEYENKFSDLALFNAVHQFLSPVLHGLFLILIAYIFWNELHYYTHGNVVATGLTTFYWYLGLWIFQLLFNIIYLFSKSNKSFLTNHIIEVQNDAFYEETKYNKSFFYWPGIASAVPRPGFVAVYVSGHAAHIIPNRAFASEAQRTVFLALVKEKILAHKES